MSETQQPVEAGETPVVEQMPMQSHVVHHARPALPVVEFGTFRDPESALIEAELVAKAFARRAAGLNLFKQIGDSRHLKIEGWQMLAMMYRVTAGVVETRYVEMGNFSGFEATAEALLIQGAGLPPIRISTAQAMCLNDEERWDVRPEYEWKILNGKNVKNQVGEVAVPLQQLRSMAQTRACSKVLSNLLKFVAVMAGYAGTPAEEMTGNETQGSTRPQGQQPQRSGKAAPTDPISEAQLGRLFAIAKSAGKSEEAVGIVLEHFKYPTTEGVRSAAVKILRKDYDAIVNEVQRA